MSVNEVKLPKATRKLEVRGAGNEGSHTFIIGDEDHTLGNTIRHILMQNPNVSFAGYSMPHPMDPFVNVRVQTVGPKKDEEQAKATDALSDACKTLSAQCDFILSKVEGILPEVHEDRLVIDKVAEELRTMKIEEEDDDDDDDEDDDELMDTVYE